MTCVTIGPATLYCGDAYAIRPTLGFHDADVMDPPYAFRASGAGRYRKRRPMFDQIIADNLHRGFDMAIVNPLLCGAAIVFAHTDQLAELLGRVAGQFHRHALCVWQKTNPQPIANKHYRSDAEFYVHAWNRGHHPAGTLADLMRISRISSPRGPARFDHPTTKPDALMTKIVANAAGTSICDPFMGTGSTGVAAIRAGKRFAGIEHNPDHFATAVRRLTAAVAELADQRERTAA
ncbi:DNA methyltransferase [Sphingomonas aquatilis]|uniref:DNA methyltransferase n=1 Tax=Sphingomonas aquatilis TaxID=93063 RepID=UPI0023FA17ED|nr:DNA methyltransferase [Sphingomonas aquatilis]MCI4653089.1 site-specific DNA-methyltransferase [Sphingomonas aquatilis]